MPNYKRTIIKSLIWSGAFALLLAGTILIGMLTRNAGAMFVCQWVLYLAAFIGYFVMRKKDDVGWLQLLICIVFVAAAAYGGFAWVVNIDFHTSDYVDLTAVAYVIFIRQFFCALLIIDAVYLLYRGVSSFRAKREERFLERYAQEYRLTHPEIDDAKEGK